MLVSLRAKFQGTGLNTDSPHQNYVLKFQYSFDNGIENVNWSSVIGVCLFGHSMTIVTFSHSVHE